MKYKVLQLIFLSFLSVQMAQAQEWECDLLNKGVDFVQHEKFDSALYVWKKVVREYPDTSNCYGRSFNNIPVVYAQIGNIEKAKAWYRKILDSELNDLDEGNSIMAPYANYKHNACLRMSQLLKEEGELEESFEYIELAEHEFPYQTFSATSFEKRAVLITYYKAELWKLKGDEKEALFTMLEKILDNDVFFRKPDAASFTNVDFYAGLIEDIIPMIEEHYGFAAFEDKLKDAIRQVKVKRTKVGDDNSKAKLATFIFEGRSFNIGSSNKKFNKKKFKQKLLNNRLFEEIKM
ncbi:hypothetical protein RCC89_00775 [Cytophagaceae bacterium ABcell3]|nr:hypothetical protein RCC89_00775 [Cytophagaceae bacterium ABcell3]